MSLINFNPVITSTAAGSFAVTSEGLIQGTSYADPSARNWLSGGVLASTESLPMWGGVGISDAVPTQNSTTGPALQLGPTITRATTLTAAAAGVLTGFSVFDQVHSAINTPQSPVPLVGSGMSVNFYRLGSNARIAVAADSALASLEAGVSAAQVSWDFGRQCLTPYVAAYAAGTVSSAAYTSSTGVLALTMSASQTIPVGTYVTISGMTPSTLNGTWAVTSSSGTALSVQATIGLGTLSVSGGTVNAGGGALPATVLELQVGNSMTVSYSPTTGFATWNRSGSAAVILI